MFHVHLLKKKKKGGGGVCSNCRGVFGDRHLLKRGGAQLDGDVLELPVPLGAEVADDVRVLVRLPQQLNFSVGEAEALGEDPLHRHAAVVEPPPCGDRKKSAAILPLVTNRVALTHLYTIVPSAP